MSIQCGELLHGRHEQPFPQIFPLPAVQGMKRQDRKGEVIYPEFLSGNLHLDRVMFMYLRQDLHPVRFHQGFCLTQQIPDIRLHEETAGVRLLHRIGKGIQPDNGRTVAAHGNQILPDKFLRCSAFHI